MKLFYLDDNKELKINPIAYSIPEYNKIITQEQYKAIGACAYDAIKSKGISERNLLDHNVDIALTKKGYYLNKKANEIAFRSSRNMYLTNEEKQILVSNILYPNDESFVYYLNNCFSLEDLKNISSILKKYKQLQVIYNKMNYNPEFDIEKNIYYIIFGNISFLFSFM